MARVVVTGANRGLGLEFTRQYLARGYQVIACCRSPESADELNSLAEKYSQLEMFALDVTSRNQINTLAIKLDGAPVDILINNAGVLGSNCAKLGHLRQQVWLNVFAINSIAPALMTQALKDNLAASEQKKVIGISSELGSIKDNVSGGMYAYRASKSALNQVMRNLAQDLGESGIISVALHPGWVQTDMGGEQAPVSASNSVAGMLKVIDGLDSFQSGQFFDYCGEPIPW